MVKIGDGQKGSQFFDQFRSDPSDPPQVLDRLKRPMTLPLVDNPPRHHLANSIQLSPFDPGSAVDINGIVVFTRLLAEDLDLSLPPSRHFSATGDQQHQQHNQQRSQQQLIRLAEPRRGRKRSDRFPPLSRRVRLVNRRLWFRCLARKIL